MRFFGAKSLAKSLTKCLGKTLGKTLGETVGETFRAKKSRQEFCRESRIGLYIRMTPGKTLYETRFFYAGGDNRIETENGADRTIME